MDLGKIAEELRSEKMEKLIAPVRISKPFLNGRLSEPHRTRIPLWNFTGEHKLVRGESHFKGYTGVVLLEVNRLSSFQEAAALRNELSGYPQVVLAFVGCSGTSVKFLVRFVSGEGEFPVDRDEVKRFHASACDQALRFFLMQLSRTPEVRSNDLCVLCRASFDPDRFYNEEASPVVIHSAATQPALSVKAGEDQLLKGKTRIESESYLFSVAMQNAFSYDLGDDLFAARSVYLVKLAENCFNSGIGEETAVQWTLYHTAFRNCEDEVRMVFKTSYKTEQRFGARPVITKDHKRVLDTMEFLERRFCFRRNRMKGGVEFKINSLTIEPYRFVAEEDLNSISIEGQKEGLDVWDRDVKRHVKSNHIPDYYPVDEFLNSLPVWDGKDYIRQLADTVPCKNSAEWRNQFYIWFLGMVATWQKDEKRYANSVLPLLVGSQGCGKSTWCKRILPPELNEYYTDSIDFSKKTDAALSLTRFALINIDE
ncbi:MAG: BT4734/BF3469 family protein, partial [Bacteroidales bacterium]